MISAFVAHHRVLVGTVPPVLGGIAFLLLMHPRIRPRIGGFFPYIVGISWLVTRPLFYACIYVFCVVPKSFEGLFVPSDATCVGGWVYQSARVLGGRIPYRDFFSNYSILFSYILSFAYKVWHSPLAFVPLFILFDLGCLFLVYAVGKHRWGMALARDATLAFTLLPITWYTTVRQSQDEVTLAFFALLGTLLWMKKRHVLAMVLFGIGFCCTKFMFGLIVLPFLLVSKRKIRDAAVFAGVLVAINLPFALAGANVLAPFLNQEGQYGGHGLWSAALAVFGISDHNRIFYSAAMLTFAIAVALSVFIAAKRKIRPDDAACALLMISIALSPRSFIVYALVYMPLFMVYAVGRKETLNLALFSVLALVMHKFTFVLPEGSAAYRAWYGVYALYITIVQIYWALKIFRSRGDEETTPVTESAAVPSAVA